MSLEIPQNFRELTKKYAPEERQKTAKEIWSLRANHFERVRLLEDRIGHLKNNMEIDADEIQKLQEECSTIEQEISQLRDSIFHRLFKNSQIREKEKELHSAGKQAIIYEDKYAELSKQLETLEETRADKSQLQSARGILDNFYENQLKFYPEYVKKHQEELEHKEQERIANERAESIESVIEDYDVFFIHAIHPNLVPGENSMLEEDTDWQTKLKITIGFAPTLSVSSVKKGDYPNNFWAHFGVVLKKGTVESAYSGDGATVAYDADTRQSYHKSTDNLAEQVRKAIQRTDPGSRYNEFSVSNPEIAGLFVFPLGSNEKNDRELRTPSHLDVFHEAKKLNMPVFIFSNGTFESARYDKRKQTYVAENNPIDPKDVLDMSQAVSEETRVMAREEILADSPFKMHKAGKEAYEDFSCLLSYAQGREMFTGLYLSQNKISGKEIVNVNGKPVRTICRFPKPGFVNHMYSLENGSVFVDRIRKGKVDFSLPITSTEYKRNDYIQIGHNTFRLGNVAGIRDYTRLMEEKITQLSTEIKTSTDEKIRLLNKNILRRLASHCLGFAEQADFLGDKQAAEVARRVALQIMNINDFKKLSDKRLGPNGEMRITKEDLYHTDNKAG